MAARRNSADGMGCVGCLVLLVLGYGLVMFALKIADWPTSSVTESETSHAPSSDPEVTEPGLEPEETEPEETEPEPARGVQGGIQFGYACSPVGALGNAGDGRPAECFVGRDGRARWGYDSDRG
ncbi:hypothetical protein [Streptomyces arboris]|uniref:hypothetical protein n=1 Tax=Streptomyces arboris TaxID=2600619 RepID=UPI003BF51A8A